MTGMDERPRPNSEKTRKEIDEITDPDELFRQTAENLMRRMKEINGGDGQGGPILKDLKGATRKLAELAERSETLTEEVRRHVDELGETIPIRLDGEGGTYTRGRRHASIDSGSDDSEYPGYPRHRASRSLSSGSGYDTASEGY